MGHWASDSIFYHLYPLGFCGAPFGNDFTSEPVPRLEKVGGWLDHLEKLGVNALYLGPVFESGSHGYDTVDYRRVDRRLGENRTLAELCRTLHARGFRVILDGVFNHVGRDFWAFRDVRERLAASGYTGWFQGLRFGEKSPYGDPFTYDGWSGHMSLVKLDLRHPPVVDYLLKTVADWVERFDIDGLRLDVADCLDPGFLTALSGFCRGLRSDFWLLGEVIHGDYAQWANPKMLDSVTNYECYKGLYSSHVDANYFEIAYALNRQFGEKGLYSGIPLYAFADNHDVDRVASSLRNPAHLLPLYFILFTMPGVPSIYYGSEWGITAKRSRDSDRDLRPCLDLDAASRNSPRPELARHISRLARIRRSSKALKCGDYRQLHVSHEQLAFMRQADGESIVVAVNSAARPAAFKVRVRLDEGTRLVDAWDGNDGCDVREGTLSFEVPPCAGRILAAPTS